MGYLETWKILEEIIIELRKKGVSTNANVMNDLKAARTLMELTKSENHDQSENGLRIEQYLSSVEASLVSEAQEYFPSERVDEWLRRLDGSSCEVGTGAPVKSSGKDERFVVGVPRDQKWVRVNAIASLSTRKVEELAVDSGLLAKTEPDGHIIVYGSTEGIKDFVKKIAKETVKESA